MGSESGSRTRRRWGSNRRPLAPPPQSATTGYKDTSIVKYITLQFSEVRYLMEWFLNKDSGFPTESMAICFEVISYIIV